MIGTTVSQKFIRSFNYFSGKNNAVVQQKENDDSFKSSY